MHILHKLKYDALICHFLVNILVNIPIHKIWPESVDFCLHFYGDWLLNAIKLLLYCYKILWTIKPSKYTSLFCFSLIYLYANNADSLQDNINIISFLFCIASARWQHWTLSAVQPLVLKWTPVAIPMQRFFRKQPLCLVNSDLGIFFSCLHVCILFWSKPKQIAAFKELSVTICYLVIFSHVLEQIDIFLPTYKHLAIHKIYSY